jgi:signal transduction histidine kinase
VLRSLERRFAVGLTLSLSAAFGLLFWGAVAAVRALGEAYVAARLQHDAEALVGAFWVAPDGEARLRERRVTPIYQQPLSGHYYVLLLADGREIRSRSLWDEALDDRRVGPGEVRTWHSPGPDGQRLLVRSAGYRKGGEAFTLTLAEDLSPLHDDIRRFQVWAAATLVLALLAIVSLQRLILRRGFRTLDTAREEVRRIATGELHRLSERGPTEIRPLTGEINRLLEQLHRRLQRSRQSLGNLAHGLKGPLSLLTRELDRAELPPGEKQRLTGQLARIDQLVQRELKRARVAGEGAGQGFDPSHEVPDLIDALGLLYRERDLRIEVGALPPGTLPFEREDMLELLGNLLDNACKYADRVAQLAITVADDAVRIRVRDDGPGVPDDGRAKLLLRGSRLDEQAPGHGLGLAIVRDLVEDYGGRLMLGSAQEGGGLEVIVTLPLDRAPTAEG